MTRPEGGQCVEVESCAGGLISCFIVFMVPRSRNAKGVTDPLGPCGGPSLRPTAKGPDVRPPKHVDLLSRRRSSERAVIGPLNSNLTQDQNRGRVCVAASAGPSRCVDVEPLPALYAATWVRFPARTGWCVGICYSGFSGRLPRLLFFSFGTEAFMKLAHIAKLWLPKGNLVGTFIVAGF